MKRVLVVPWSIAAAYFAIRISLSPVSRSKSLSAWPGVLSDGKLVRDQRAEDAADDRPHHRYQRVLPVGRALAGDGKHEVGDAGHEIAGRVDGVAGRTAQREADREDQQADDQRGESTDQVIAPGGDGDH